MIAALSTGYDWLAIGGALRPRLFGPTTRAAT